MIAAQAGIAPPSRWLGRTRLTEVDISDPRAMKVVRTYDIEGSYTSARLTGATARVVLATESRGIAMPAVRGSASPAELRRTWRRSVRRTRTRAWLPSAILRDRRTGRAERRAAVRCRQVRRTQRFSGFGTITVLTIDMDRGLPAVDADALMTDGVAVYASPDRLYVASERWLGYDPSRREVSTRRPPGCTPSPASGTRRRPTSAAARSLGQDADDEGRTTGAQLSLFDVSDPARPVRLDQESLGRGSYTDVEDDHAFTWWAPGALAVLPVAEFADDTATLVARAFRIDRAGGIQPAARIPAPGQDRFVRSLVVGDRLLLVGFEGIYSTPAAAPGAGDYTAFGG